MVLWHAVIFTVCISGLSCDDGNATHTDVSGLKENEVTASAEVTEKPLSPIAAAVADLNLTHSPSTLQNVTQNRATLSPVSAARRRRGRRYRGGYYNDNRYRNRMDYPNGPYAYRGGRPPQGMYYDPRYRPAYDPMNQQYYDPYNQGYYGYPGYPQPGYGGYPYQSQPYPQPQPQPRPPQPYLPPTPLPTNEIPDLYYVHKGEGPDGHYQYKKISVVQDNFDDRRGRRPRGTRMPQQLLPGKGTGYYGYPYDHYYNRPPVPPQQYYPQQPQQYYHQPPQQQSVYQQHPYWSQHYKYSRNPYGPAPRLRTGRPTMRGAFQSSWRLTSASSVNVDLTDHTQVPNEQATKIVQE